ncbi:hypothetical protein Cch01nite_18810 [Cellulomonas chitinilytica]|uniref:Type II secretion system protein GspF domain-containing protein n=1 Tax=Cellulomonas chitinilytica TaxID=398759 RepID=A0A919U266_9CELL|nr:type II secretion system F family protein [Cellulomonas chitinilytica]GIG21157.1 hypothetical protein Cch01nite_18810 [Cellulomonas chitinilytica]
MTVSVTSGVFGALVVGGAAGMVVALRRQPPRASAARARSGLARRWSRTPRRTKNLLAVATLTGVLLALLTGWLVSLMIVPLAALMLPYLLADPPSARQIRRVEAMEEWTRGLAGVLAAGVGLEQAVTATLRSTPDAIRPEVTRLVGRLRARWDTRKALLTFADELDDVTGDLIAANLILAAQRRNRSLAAALQGVAESVSEDVASRRRVEAGRAKPRGSARIVTLFSLGVLGVLALTGDYVAPYGTPLGQLVLAVLLAAYVGALVWMRKMSEGKPMKRFLGPAARAGAR